MVGSNDFLFRCFFNAHFLVVVSVWLYNMHSSTSCFFSASRQPLARVNILPYSSNARVITAWMLFWREDLPQTLTTGGTLKGEYRGRRCPSRLPPEGAGRGGVNDRGEAGWVVFEGCDRQYFGGVLIQRFAARVSMPGWRHIPMQAFAFVGQQVGPIFRSRVCTPPSLENPKVVGGWSRYEHMGMRLTCRRLCRD
eukprot:768323-Hanusia_phi.AAC.3